MQITVIGTPSENLCRHCGSNNVLWHTRRETFYDDEDCHDYIDFVDYESCYTCDFEHDEVCSLDYCKECFNSNNDWKDKNQITSLNKGNEKI